MNPASPFQILYLGSPKKSVFNYWCAIILAFIDLQYYTYMFSFILYTVNICL